MSNNLQTLSSFPFEDFNTVSDFTGSEVNSYHLQSYLFQIEDNSISARAYANIVEHQLRRNRFDKSKDTVLLICSKDQSRILKYSLDQLRSFGIDKKYDILLIDDRSKEDILSISDEYGVSYLRIDNQLDKFNYSLLNNIGSCYAKAFNKKTLIFFNNDMWPKNKNSLDNVLDQHRKTKSFVTGCKLVYPSESEYEQLGKPQHLLQPHLNQIYNTIQHGGICFAPRQSVFGDKNRNYFSENFVMAPLHSWRFYNENERFASTNSSCFAVTGALQIIDTNNFIDIGGFNMTMTMAFQDIDLCIRAIKNALPVSYIGSETMIHAESITNAFEKITQTPEFLSDNISWDLTWGVELPSIIGYQRSFR